MAQQKIVITSDAKEINEQIALGWIVKSVTAQHVAIDHGNSNLTAIAEKPAIRGYFCFLLENFSK